MTDEQVIEIIAQRMEEECGWSKASTVLNHYGWVDVVTHLFLEKGLRGPLIDLYAEEIVRGRLMELDRKMCDSYVASVEAAEAREER